MSQPLVNEKKNKEALTKAGGKNIARLFTGIGRKEKRKSLARQNHQLGFFTRTRASIY